jgi:hypothetical protein
MIWEDLFRLYEEMCGDTEDAIQEKNLHMDFGNKAVFKRADVPEEVVPNEEVATVASQDYVETSSLASTLYAILAITNKDDSRKLDPEPNGFRGRHRYYLDGTDKPPEGSPSYYIRKGTRIYLRDTPSAIGALIISYKFFPADLDDTLDLSLSPILPVHLHMAIPMRAAANYYEMHPPRIEGRIDPTMARELKSNAWGLVDEMDGVTSDENLDRRQYVRQMGYGFSIGGR